jgi:cytidylate kinase
MLEKALQFLQHEGTGHSEQARSFTVAISREAGADGHLVARALGDLLHWPVYDRELVERIAADMGFRPSLVERVDEKQASWLEGILETLSSAPKVGEVSYARHLVKTLLSLAAEGECVILGRGAAQLLPPTSTLRIRLVAALEDRVAVIQKRRHCSREQALSWIKETDRERQLFVRNVFGKDPSSLDSYDLIISTSRFSVGESAALIAEALQQLQARTPAKKPEPALAE